MNHAKSFFFVITMLITSAVQAKSPNYQSDIFYEISRGNTKAVKAWLKSKPNLSAKNAQKESLLHAAVLSGNRSMVKMLVKAGVAINAVDGTGKTALDYAVEQNQSKIITDLLNVDGKVCKTENFDRLALIMHKKK